MKKTIRDLLIHLPFKITRNLYYDRLTRKIICNELMPESCAVDIGCHQGEVLDIFLKAAPNGQHYAFEPIPELASALNKKYQHNNVQIFDVALSNYQGVSSFNYVYTNPAYSGLLKRSYDRPEKDQQIEVRVERLDQVLNNVERIDLIKIDVEGGEMNVLEGAEKLLKKHRPLLIFEHGLGGSEHYGTTPEELFEYLTAYGYKIFTLEKFRKNLPALTKNEFSSHFYQKTEYYFSAKFMT